jgi:hypothetical protein
MDVILPTTVVSYGTEIGFEQVTSPISSIDSNLQHKVNTLFLI